jgi:hypothetical protein
MFLIYSGIFRDNSNPLDVAKYYIECLRNREGFLTYSICKKEAFNEDRIGAIYSKYRMHLIKKVELDLLNINDRCAQVEIEMIYEDSQVYYLNVRLDKSGSIWLIANGV